MNVAAWGRAKAEFVDRPVQFILGWEPSSVRPPIFPARLDTLLQENSVK